MLVSSRKEDHMQYRAAEEYYLDLWYDDFEPTELLMLYGMFQRSYSRLCEELPYPQTDYQRDDLRVDMVKESCAAYQMLMHKIALISDTDAYVTDTGDIMGLKPRWKHPIRLDEG